MILVAYVPRAEGRAAVHKGIEMAKLMRESLLVVNGSAGTTVDDESIAPRDDVREIEKELAASGVKAEFMQLIRGKPPAEEIASIVETQSVSMLVIGLRKRTLVGKLFLGSVAQEMLLSVSCPVLAVKAH